MFTVAPPGELTVSGKCLVAGDASLRAGSLLYLGECSGPESAWIYADGFIHNRANPAKVLSAFWSGHLMVADRVPQDLNQAYRLGRFVEERAATAFDSAKPADARAAIVQRGQRAVVVRGSVIDFGPRRSLLIHR